jgi:hypothetical protein
VCYSFYLCKLVLHFLLFFFLFSNVYVSLCFASLIWPIFTALPRFLYYWVVHTTQRDQY